MAPDEKCDGHLKTTHNGFDKSRVIKRSVLVGGHKTSISLEDVFWSGLREIARERNVHLSRLVGEIDFERRHANLSSAIRLFVFGRYRRRD